jgi:hypothetical protein
MPRGVKKENLPEKVCVVCNRPFTWRKKWERCWDEVTTCSKSCNSARKQLKGASGGSQKDENSAAEDTLDIGQNNANVEVKTDADLRQERKAAVKAAKALKRAKREGAATGEVGQKSCDTCSKGSDLLVRCQVDETKAWRLVCGKCWKVASGGVPDGDAAHPHYRYGGLWKNRAVKGSSREYSTDATDTPEGLQEEDDDDSDAEMEQLVASMNHVDVDSPIGIEAAGRVH